MELAVTPESPDESFAEWFPKEIKSSPPLSSRLLGKIENQVCYVVDACVEIITKTTMRTLKKRKKPVTNIEKEKIKEELSNFLNAEDIDWALSLTDEWITKKELRLDNPEATLRIVNSLYDNIRFGASMFLESGGDFKSLNTSLIVAKRCAPERDQPVPGSN